MRNNNHNKDNQYENCDTDMDRGAYNDMLNSDNAFSDKGLENAALSEEISIEKPITREVISCKYSKCSC